MKKEIIKTDMAKILSEISELKNQVQLIDETNDPDLKHSYMSSISNKKSKTKKVVNKKPTKKKVNTRRKAKR